MLLIGIYCVGGGLVILSLVLTMRQRRRAARENEAALYRSGEKRSRAKARAGSGRRSPGSGLAPVGPPRRRSVEDVVSVPTAEEGDGKVGRSRPPQPSRVTPADGNSARHGRSEPGDISPLGVPAVSPGSGGGSRGRHAKGPQAGIPVEVPAESLSDDQPTAAFSAVPQPLDDESTPGFAVHDDLRDDPHDDPYGDLRERSRDDLPDDDPFDDNPFASGPRPAAEEGRHPYWW